MSSKFRFLIVLFTAAISFTTCKQQAKIESAPLAIEISTATEQWLPNTMQFIAPISANYSATIQPRIAGFLTSSSFGNGMPVKRGQLIFTMDDAQQRANRLAAEATLSSAKLRASYSASTHQRHKPNSIRSIYRRKLCGYSIRKVSGAEPTQCSIGGELHTHICTNKWHYFIVCRHSR